jgi:hypothetical protein
MKGKNMIKTHKDNLVKRCEERGYSLEEAMPCVIKQEGDMWTIDENHEKYPKQKVKEQQGAGTELKKILASVGIRSTPNCSCNAKATAMNKNGIDWCKNNKDIILSWLQEEAVKRKLPFFRFFARRMINIAISRAEKTENNS